MNKVQKITPHLWFDKEAKEAAEFYVSSFGGDSEITSAAVIKDTPSGDTEMVTFRLLGQNFLSISAGPIFKLNPSISFFVNFDPSKSLSAKEDLDALWEKLSKGGTVMMELNKYPFSERYGWVQDKYGVSWQLILSNANGEPRPNIMPSLLFTGSLYGKAEAAMKFYMSVFKDSKEGIISHYGKGKEPDTEEAVMYEDFSILGEWFAAMESALPHKFTFNEAISFVVSCDTQEEIDYYWEKLSAHPEAEQCGWCKDKFNVSWQIVPSSMGKLMGGTPEQRARVTQSFLKMKKFNIADLESAFEGK
ncbi:MAG: VOC family protein [Candidatus Doudnabacteria bacterium]